MKNFITFFIIISSLIGCKKEPFNDFYILETATKVEEVGKDVFLSRIGVSNPALSLIVPNKKLNVVSLSYHTQDPSGNDIIASGTITYPTGLTSFQSMGAILGLHFTIGSNKEAPSVRMASHEAMLAFFGYVVVAPDYIGYGETVDKTHPYHHAENTGRVATDMLFAAREYFASQNIRFPRNLTLMGYSEGGYAAVATQKFLEAEFPGWMNIENVFAGAGAYDLPGSYKYFMETKFSSQPATIPMLVLGLDYGDNLNLDLSKIFKEPLLSNYKEWILSKDYTTKELSDKLGYTSIADFLAPELFDNNHPNTKILLASLEKNSLIKDWKPQAKIFLIHGQDDTIVPYINSVSAYDYFKSIGCNVSLHPIKGKDHIPTGNDFYLFCIMELLKISTNKGDPDSKTFVEYLENNDQPIFNF